MLSSGLQVSGKSCFSECWTENALLPMHWLTQRGERPNNSHGIARTMHRTTYATLGTMMLEMQRTQVS